MPSSISIATPLIRPSKLKVRRGLPASLDFLRISRKCRDVAFIAGRPQQRAKVRRSRPDADARRAVRESVAPNCEMRTSRLHPLLK